MNTLLLIVGLIVEVFAFYHIVRFGARLSDRIAAFSSEWPNVFICAGVLLICLGVMIGLQGELNLFERAVAFLALGFAGGIAARVKQRAMRG
jgi:uncharacterized membrane protein